MEYAAMESRPYPCCPYANYTDPATAHSHMYNLQTTLSDGHTHYIAGMLSAETGGLDQHVHYYSGVTTHNDGHQHKYVGITGPAVPVQGGHVHYMSGVTSFENHHIHYYGNYTALPVNPAPQGDR